VSFWETLVKPPEAKNFSQVADSSLNINFRNVSKTPGEFANLKNREGEIEGAAKAAPFVFG
jgi:hypothetical protein